MHYNPCFWHKALLRAAAQWRSYVSDFQIKTITRRNLILNALAAAVLCLANAAPAAGSQQHVWYDGHNPVTFWVSADAPLVVQTAWSRCAADAPRATPKPRPAS